MCSGHIYHNFSCCDDLRKFGKEYLNSLKCEFCTFFSIKLRKFWHTARLSRTNRHKVIKSENSPVFWPTLYIYVIANIQFTPNIYKESSSGKKWKSVKVWQNYDHEFVVSLSWPTLYNNNNNNQRHFKNVSAAKTKNAITLQSIRRTGIFGALCSCVRHCGHVGLWFISCRASNDSRSCAWLSSPTERPAPSRCVIL